MFICPNCKSESLLRSPQEYDQWGNNCACGYPDREEIRKSKSLFKFLFFIMNRKL